MLKLLESENLGHVLQFKPAAIQQDPNSIDIDEAIEKCNSALIDVMRLAKEGYGSYLEIGYEWAYQEVVEILEILDIAEAKNEQSQLQQELTNKHAYK